MQFKTHSHAKIPIKPFPVNKKQAIYNPWKNVKTGNRNQEKIRKDQRVLTFAFASFCTGDISI